MTNSKSETSKMSIMKSISLVPEQTESLILEKTPSKYIKTRPGPFNKPLSYIEVGYVIDRLNKIFNYNWNFEITEQTIGKRQVFVRGRLTGNLPRPDGSYHAIVKEQYGGIDIKFNRTTGDTVSIADDLKSASSDALKKCASLFGIAQDLYWLGGGECAEEDGHTAARQDDGLIHESTGQATPEEDEIVLCETCGDIVVEKSGITNGKKWHGLFCSSGDKSHVKWLK